MAAVNSTMLDLGTTAPEFSLKDTNGKKLSINDVKGDKGLLVAFWCNHCPYVKHIRDQFITLAGDWMNKGVGVVAIMSNDVDNYPDDSPEKMAEESRNFSYPFPYLYDETQKVAHAYRAACTPDFFLFDKDLKLVYRGQFDASRPKNVTPVTGQDMARAIDQLLVGEQIPEEQVPSIGCNIKWKPGNEPDFFSKA
ncbi:MAG: thioredoxin family protein [Bacteroidetes bacterium]|nr:thioredoxin family protein [Bacteroidota bacterium]